MAEQGNPSTDNQYHFARGQWDNPERRGAETNLALFIAEQQAIYAEFVVQGLTSRALLAPAIEQELHRILAMIGQILFEMRQLAGQEQEWLLKCGVESMANIRRYEGEVKRMEREGRLGPTPSLLSSTESEAAHEEHLAIQRLFEQRQQEAVTLCTLIDKYDAHAASKLSRQY